MKKRIILIASSSGGHIFPILGLANLLKEDYDIFFIGIKGKIEQSFYPKNSLFLDIPSSYKLVRKKENKKRFNSALKKLKDFIKKDDLVISGGGFASYLIHKINHKKVIILEQNRIIGDSNLLLGLKAKKILASMDIRNNIYFYKTENIINPSLFRITNKDVKKENLIIFIFGSLSSSSLVHSTCKYLLSNMLNKDYRYELVVGKFYDEIKSINFKDNVLIKKSINDINHLKKAKLVFSRAGGTTISELLYFKIPFVLIPSPYVKHNHQEINAKYIYKKYNAPYILEKNYNANSINHFINSLDSIKINYQVENNGINEKKIKEIINEIA